jgi:hypothetical protein
VKRWPTILFVAATVPAVSSAAAEEFRFTDFVVSNGVLRFDATWATEDPPPGGIVDLYCRTNLAHGAARILHTETNAVAPLSFAIDEDAVPVGGAAFFLLGTRVDADGDAMPDAWELGNGLDPADPADSVRDDDCDGLANLHELWHGTDPNAPDGADTALAVLARSVDARLSDKAPATALPYFRGYPQTAFATNALLANPACWASDVDLSCESPWNDEAKNRKSGTLVSPVHMLLANHHKPPDPGTNFWFRAPDGTVYVRSIQAKRRIVSTPDTDLVVALLDEPLPPAIVPAKILPENFREHLGSGLGLPAVSLDQEGKILVSEIVDLATDELPEHGLPSFATSRVPLDPTRAKFYETLVAGDSSNPKFLLLEDQPILLSIHWYENHAGSSIRRYADLVDAAMTNLSPDLGYRLETVDLDRFRKLPSMP